MLPWNIVIYSRFTDMSTRTASLIISVKYILPVVHAPLTYPITPVQVPPASTVSQYLLYSPLNTQQLLRHLLKVGNLPECQALEQLCMDFGCEISLNYCGSHLTVTESVILVALRM